MKIHVIGYNNLLFIRCVVVSSSHPWGSQQGCFSHWKSLHGCNC